MGLLADVARLKKAVRKRLILEGLRQFPNLTEQELRSALKAWKLGRSGSLEELKHLLDHGCFPDGSHLCGSVPTDSRPRLHGEAEPVITEGKALKLIDELAPIISMAGLGDRICLEVERNRRTQAEFNFMIQCGHWPEFEPGKTELDIKYFREHGCWPGEEDEDGNSKQRVGNCSS